MLHSMESELQVRFSNTDAYEMVDGLKALFASQFRIMKYELRDKFLSTEMEEKTPAWKVTWQPCRGFMGTLIVTWTTG